MKYLVIIVFFISCSGDPLVAPSALETVWVDAATQRDTIITNVNNQPAILYFAVKDWQIAGSSLLHGYRFIGVRYGDSVLVKPLDDSSGNYTGPYLVAVNTRNDTLRAQNFLDSNNTNPSKTYVLLNH